MTDAQLACALFAAPFFIIGLIFIIGSTALNFYGEK
jgi:hypothetical protein